MPDARSDLLRCPSCGAGNPSAAPWCGQCLYRFDGPGEAGGAEHGAPRPTAARQMSPLVHRGPDGVSWICPACAAANSLEADSCSRCGTRFASFFAETRQPARRRASAGMALALSAGLPGLGHWALGATGAAVARSILYVWTLGVGLLMLIRPPGVGRPVVRAVGIVFTLSAAAVWLLAFAETRRLADGDVTPMIPPKALTVFSAVLSGTLIAGLVAAVVVGR